MPQSGKNVVEGLEKEKTINNYLAIIYIHASTKRPQSSIGNPDSVLRPFFAICRLSFAGYFQLSISSPRPRPKSVTNQVV
jgi:hypothetical protein